jgi:hypothetical protein
MEVSIDFRSRKVRTAAASRMSASRRSTPERPQTGSRASHSSCNRGAGR